MARRSRTTPKSPQAPDTNMSHTCQNRRNRMGTIQQTHIPTENPTGNHEPINTNLPTTLPKPIRNHEHPYTNLTKTPQPNALQANVARKARSRRTTQGMRGRLSRIPCVVRPPHASRIQFACNAFLVTVGRKGGTGTMPPNRSETITILIITKSNTISTLH